LFDGLGRCFWEAANKETKNIFISIASTPLPIYMHVLFHPAPIKHTIKKEKQRKGSKPSSFCPLQPQTFRPWTIWVGITTISGTPSSKTKTSIGNHNSQHLPYSP